MARTKRDIVEYRIYDLPVDLPVFTLSGEQWRISDTPSSRLHFHNCLEIGFCHSDSGYIRFEDETVSFKAGDVFLIPRHVPHSTYSTKGCRSLWSYLFVDLDSLARTPLNASKSSLETVHWPSRYLKFSAASPAPRIPFLVQCMFEEALHPQAESAQLLRVYAWPSTRSWPGISPLPPSRSPRPRKSSPSNPHWSTSWITTWSPAPPRPWPPCAI